MLQTRSFMIWAYRNVAFAMTHVFSSNLLRVTRIDGQSIETHASCDINKGRVKESPTCLMQTWHAARSPVYFRGEIHLRSPISTTPLCGLLRVPSEWMQTSTNSKRSVVIASHQLFFRPTFNIVGSAFLYNRKCFNCFAKCPMKFCLLQKQVKKKKSFWSEKGNHQLRPSFSLCHHCPRLIKTLLLAILDSFFLYN